jgi:hypothetical protein
MISRSHIAAFLNPSENKLIKPWIQPHTGLRDPVYIFSLLYTFFLPFYRIAPVIVIAVWVIMAVFTYRWKLVGKAWAKNPVNYCLLLLYLMYVLSLFFTANMDESLVKLQVKISYILLPVLLAPAIDFDRAKQFNLLKAFIAGTSISILVNLFISFSHFLIKDNTAYFFYHYVTEFHHTSYYALYLNFAVFAMLYLQRYRSLRNLWLLIPMLIIHIGMVFLLSSKAGIIVLFLALIIEAISRLRKHANLKHLLIFTTSIIVLVVLSLFNDRVRDAFDYIQLSETESISEPGAISDAIIQQPENSSSSRVMVWTTCAEVIPQHWLFGVTPGDVTDKLVKSYKAHNYEGPAENRLNCHNQFMQTQLGLGIVATILLLTAFLLPFFGKQRPFKRLAAMFLVLVFASFMFESMLETQSGVQFILFFLVLFSYQRLNDDIYDTIFTTTN